MRVAAAGAALVALTSAACTTHAGSAAQVGDSTISSSTLRGLVDRGSQAVAGNPDQAQTLDKATLQRKLLSLLVTDKLLQQQAAKLGVSVSGQDVAAYDQAFGLLNFGSVAKFHQQLAQAGIGASDVDRYLRFGALQEKVEDRISPAPKIADSTLRSQYDQVVQQVGKIPLSFTDAKPWIARFMANSDRSSALANRLVSASKDTSVSINPRFGTWDAGQLGVASADGTIATKVAPAPTTASASQ